MVLLHAPTIILNFWIILYEDLPVLEIGSWLPLLCLDLFFTSCLATMQIATYAFFYAFLVAAIEAAMRQDATEGMCGRQANLWGSGPSPLFL